MITFKSFVPVGKSLDHCFDCSYCRANTGEKIVEEELPGTINPLFKSLPIFVNGFYGDPSLQPKHTLEMLRKLEEGEHKGPVVIITKGSPTFLKEWKGNLDLHLGFSYFKGEDLKEKMKEAKDMGIKYNIEFRPICCEVNDDEKNMRKVFEQAKEGECPIAWSGLQDPPQKGPWKAYPGHTLGKQKYVSNEVKERLRTLSKEYEVPIFEKTSCVISWMHGFERDYNVHYLKPDVIGCKDCPMYEKCMRPVLDVNVELPFEYEIIHKENHKCSFVVAGLCKFPSPGCLKMNGEFIVPKVAQITRGDYRIIKWLTGLMPQGVPMVEDDHPSEFWKRV